MNQTANGTANGNDLNCTLATCPLSDAFLDYDPSLGGNAFYIAVFATVLVSQIVQLIRYRTWSYSLCVMFGLVLEIIGYVGRVQMHFNPFLSNPFLM